MDATSNDRAPSAAVRLSWAQKRDLLGMSAASVITAALIAAPAILPREEGAADVPSLEVSSPAPGTLTPMLIATRVDAPVVPRQAERRQPVVHRAAPPQPMWVARVASAAPVIVVNARMDVPRKPLARRLAGFLTGDGTHSVRPFPTISAER